MPRTKMSKQAGAKRNRNDPSEEEVRNVLREVDYRIDATLNDLKLEYEQAVHESNGLIGRLQAKYATELLSMTIGDIREMGTKGMSTLDEISVYLRESKSRNGEISSNLFSTNNSNFTFNSKGGPGRDDEGYLTEDGRNSHNQPNIRQIGPLQSAQAVTRNIRRRSKSATPLDQSKYIQPRQQLPRSISQQSAMQRSRLLQPVGGGLATEHSSRAKYRTPVKRMQTMSADRGVMNPVTPKCAPNLPITMFRYPRAGETVISLSGSPVVAQGISASLGANINIPTENGFYMLQPNACNAIESDMIPTIDSVTLEQLRQLQSNLDMIVRNAMDH